jgi:PAS domain S-box-containing protein
MPKQTSKNKKAAQNNTSPKKVSVKSSQTKTVKSSNKNSSVFINEELASEFVKGINDCFLWSSKKENNEELVFYSDNVEKVTGYKGDELKRLPGRGSSIIYEEDIHKMKKQYSDFINTPSKKKITFIYRIVRKDNKLRWIKESIKVERDKDGNVKNSYGIVNDITDIKEEEITQSSHIENLKELNASKDKFISMLSHDLRAPFTSILGFSEILINEPNLTDSERHEYLSYINDSSQNQLQLINYLLDWSRLQTGRIKIEPLRLHAQSLVFNCVSSLTGNAIRKNIEINVDVKDFLYVQADERLLTQVITNLLSNAIKFSPEGKPIDVRANPFNRELAEFVVKDYGLGISENNRNKIFKFEKMFSTEGTKGERGTGLGLSLVKEIVEKHGGEIWFYSKENNGSEFHFTIPISHNTILLVVSGKEDIKKYEEVIRENYPSFQIISVSNGYEAMEIVLDKPPSLVITDFEMPLMNGIQLVENIRREDQNERIPIIALVPKINEDIRESYHEYGVNTLIQKPIDFKVFNDKLQFLFDYE